ncbi:preprotein translocase subunit SecG [uncultured Campylobacter sp.]|uniref:preprotein translocase subunit SecG n=1 Tax=uncultured Campylobacter sp. TaxID=218934 RepID=UPI0026393419|nr:preprotein translocase subunit SecG [uncultured Campylobacter sp.]
MTTLFIVFQCILVCAICVAVLLQKSSSIGLGAYSGSNESLFGAKGASGFLAKTTFILGLLLIINTVTLSYLYNTRANADSVAEKATSLIPSIEQNTSKEFEAPKAPNVTTVPNAIETNTSK